MHEICYVAMAMAFEKCTERNLVYKTKRINLVFQVMLEKYIACTSKERDDSEDEEQSLTDVDNASV